VNALRELPRLALSNGLRWTVYFVARRVFEHLVGTLDARMVRLEQKYQLPGINGVARNYALWQNWDWEAGGEEWSRSQEWKQSLIDDVLLKYLPPGKDVLEIGPGAGRWTEALQQRAKRLILVDLTDRCIELCKKRFAHCDNIEYHVNDGASLAFIPSESVDFIWSFDVFVHISPADTERYIADFKRILRTTGLAVIHHPHAGRSHGGYRSSMTAELFLKFLRKHGLQFVAQFDSWGPDRQFDVRLHDDMLTVFRK
jgi:ubiquinone/menaquinone biosynthesis C-methylase UbiE